MQTTLLTVIAVLGLVAVSGILVAIVARRTATEKERAIGLCLCIAFFLLIACTEIVLVRRSEAGPAVAATAPVKAKARAGGVVRIAREERPVTVPTDADADPATAPVYSEPKRPVHKLTVKRVKSQRTHHSTTKHNRSAVAPRHVHKQSDPPTGKHSKSSTASSPASGKGRTTSPPDPRRAGGG